MPRQTILSWDAKRELFETAKALKSSGFEPMPTGEGSRGRPSINWEKHPAFGDLAEYRRNVGMRRKVLSVDGFSDEECKALCLAIRSRFAKVFPDEGWSATTSGGFLYLGYTGHRIKRPRKAKA